MATFSIPENIELRNPEKFEENRENYVYKKAPLANGETVTLRFPSTVTVPKDYFVRAKDIPVTPGTPEISASFDKYWSSLDSATKALAVKKALKKQYKLTTGALAKGFLYSVANTASWNFGDDIDAFVRSAYSGKDRSEILEGIQAEQAMYETMAPTASNISKGIGYATDPTIVLAGINAARTGNPSSLAAAAAARRGAVPLTSVINPAELVSQRAVPQIVEAAGKTGLDMYGRALGEGYADSDALRSGTELGGGIQAIIRALPPVARAAFRGRSPMSVSEATRAAQQRVIGTLLRDSTTSGSLGQNLDPLMAARMAQRDAEMGSSISDPRSLASISGRNLEDVQSQATKVEPVSGQRVADAAQERAASIQKRIEESARSTGNVPYYGGRSELDQIPTAQQSINLRESRVTPVGERLRESAYAGPRTSTSEHRIVTALREWEPWRDIYNTVRVERAGQVLGTGKNRIPRVDSEGVPTLLPKSFDDYLDGKRLIPSSTYSDQVARMGGESNLPYTRVVYPENHAKAGKYVKENGHYVVELRREADYRTLHDLRKGLDAEDIQNKYSSKSLDAQRLRIDSVIKKSGDLRKHDQNYHLLKRWEDAQSAGSLSANRQSNILASDANDLYKINRDTTTPRVASERRVFRQSMIDEIRRAGYTPKELMDSGLGIKLRMMFDGLPNAQQSYEEFMRSLKKERTVERAASRLGTETKTGPLEPKKRALVSALGLLAKVPAYAFSAAFGMQRDFTESWRRLFTRQTKEEAAELNRLLDPSIVPGTREFGELIDELDTMYLKTKQPDKAVIIRNIGAMIDAATVSEHEFSSPVVPALPAESRTRQEMESSGYQTPVYSYPVTSSIKEVSQDASDILSGGYGVLDSFGFKRRPRAPLE